MLALPGPRYGGDTTIRIQDKTIHLISHPELPGTAGNIWDASVVLSDYIATLDLSTQCSPPRKVLELGAGLALCSIVAKLFGAVQVVATDLVLEGAEASVRLNHVDVEIRSLDWFRPVFIEADLIVMSDVVWVEELIAPLVSTLKVLLRPVNRAVMCSKPRSAIIDGKFLVAVSRANLRIQPIASVQGHNLIQITSS